MKATEETKAAAKAAGIKSWHIKSEETLQEELGAHIEERVEKIEAKVKMTADDLEELLDLMDGGSFGGALMSAKVNGRNSKFWKYREYLEKRVNGD